MPPSHGEGGGGELTRPGGTARSPAPDPRPRAGGGRVRAIARALWWTSVYLFLVLFPLLVLLAAPAREGAGLWWDFSMGLGFAGLAVMGIQFALTARFRRASAPFGIDVIYQFHRWVGVGGLLLVVAHYAILRTGFPDALGPASPTSAPGYMTAGRLALFLFGLVVVTSLWRRALRIEYYRWRILHGVVSTAAVVLAALHIQGAGYYTSVRWTRILWIAYSVFWVLLIVYVRLVKPARLLRRPYRVTEVRAERGDAWTLTFEPVGHAGLTFGPGQFVWLTLGGSPFRFREHPFSLSGSAEDPGSLAITIKELGDFTRTVKDTEAGATAYLDGPHGVFSPDNHPAAPGFVFVAGGVGIAPIMSMLRTLADRGDRRPMVLVYGNADRESVIFRDELEALRSRLDLRVVHVLEDPPEGWTGERGLITGEIVRRALPPRASELHYFICGPTPMSEAVQKALRDQGVPLRRVHFELFNMV
ncbi:MAG: ferric reductase-like transmembrane domain-containing protein [Gemmatimonadota bacterium]|nr:ferric reductase-like transmembrane domain-containing protein [Gemmatimonadota bacterium]